MAPTEPETKFLAYHCPDCDTVHHAYSSELDYTIRWLQCLDPECLQEFADSLGDECPHCLGDGGYGYKHPETTDHRVVVCPDCQENALTGLIPNWELELVQQRHASQVDAIRSELVRIHSITDHWIHGFEEGFIDAITIEKSVIIILRQDMHRVIDQLGPAEEPAVPIVITTKEPKAKEPKALIYQNKSGLRD